MNHMMKRFAFVMFSMLVIGCGNTYGSMQVGPARYAITSEGKHQDENSNAQLYHRAYEVCSKTGHSDYSIANSVKETNKTTLYIYCHNNDNKSETGKLGEGVASKLKHWYEEAQKKLETYSQESNP